MRQPLNYTLTTQLMQYWHQLLASDTYQDTLGEQSLKKLHHPVNRTYLYLDAWFNQAFGTAWNPLYHLGALAFFFFWIVLVTGLYLFIFFDTSIVGAYQSVQHLSQQQWYLGGVMRSLHRYASDAAVLTILLHVLREFSLDRYRGFRWFSWFTGIPTLWLVILLGITGYWLVWDQLAQYVAIGSSRLLDALPIFSSAMTRNFLQGNLSDRFFTLLAFLHLLGLPIMLVFALWIHVKRLAKVEIVVPRGLAMGCLLALLILSLVQPVTSHPQANLAISPAVLHLDWFYLNVYPLLDYWTAGETWFLTLGMTLLLMVMPWLPPKRIAPAAEVNLSHCNGCGQCFEDCPFDAISIHPRSDGARWKKEAVVYPHLCAACGICVGSCPYSNPFRRAEQRLTTGIDMPEFPAHNIREATNRGLVALATMEETVKILVFGCNHSFEVEEVNLPGVATVKLACTGMLPPAFIEYALKKGADGVLISGCRSGDCYYRFGNRWMEKRIHAERVPHLHLRVPRERVAIGGSAYTDKAKFLEELAAFRQRLLSKKTSVATTGENHG